jgi:hypothetical protein
MVESRSRPWEGEPAPVPDPADVSLGRLAPEELSSESLPPVSVTTFPPQPSCGARPSKHATSKTRRTIQDRMLLVYGRDRARASRRGCDSLEPSPTELATGYSAVQANAATTPTLTHPDHGAEERSPFAVERWARTEPDTPRRRCSSYFACAVIGIVKTTGAF